ncbi:type VII secretion protein EccB [Mycobacterium sherrisii]|uniref:Type VII secretion protein EccB n=1 Tax=Mycobacterium sherrisii TaxID=243061 RepID=A0A1E3SZY0_9MYCO|nr:type VII secretion protein EccB [Mycobacterium sherrisii]MCV7032201.1 type VII secretion protein EccB [Mycobacterium sherrisii]MEC4764903.1 type VII secretion protein EccB [Mycobacterium sherrisii]ODR07701.1 type VII secretion protein EccB [Mycobacterium sherrisii]ORW72491.1 type VII secretion protein EccB [Mycobacterium sherrisii]
MPAPVTTRAQVNGYRLLLRRMEHALIRADSRMIHDPMRGQMRALMVGVVIAVLIAGGAGVLAFFRPTPNFGDSTIMVAKSTGTMFVRIGDQLHPVLNLASARLIVGKSDTPKEVDDKFLNTVPLGPVVGIVGGPGGINRGDDMTTSSWTVCDATQPPSETEPSRAPTVETTVLANDPVLNDEIQLASHDQMILVKAGATTYLVYNGVRAAIDPTDATLRNALRLPDGQIREVSPGLLNSFPLVEPIVPVAIEGVGEPANYLPQNYRLGSILKTVDSHGEQLYVVLREGLQPISPMTADIIRYGNPQAPMAAEPTSISPALVNAVPVVHILPVDQYPTAQSRFLRIETHPVLCMSWQRINSATAASTHLLVGNRLPLPNDARPVRLATADGGGPGLDNVYLRPGTGEYVQATGSQVDSRALGQFFYIDDLGVRFHVVDKSAAAALGVTGVQMPGSSDTTAQPAPWAILKLLPAGPELSQRAALVAHDGIAADSAGHAITLPNQ